MLRKIKSIIKCGIWFTSFEIWFWNLVCDFPPKTTYLIKAVLQQGQLISSYLTFTPEQRTHPLTTLLPSMSNPNSNANNKENISENPIPPRRYHCPHCPKTFPSQVALSGHQNAHRKRSEKRPFFTSQGASGPSSSPALRMESTGTLHSSVGPVRGSPSYPFSRNNRNDLQEYFARTRREEYLRTVRSPLLAPFAPNPLSVPMAPSPPSAPMAPPEQPRSTMLFGVPNFFQSSGAPTDPSGDGASSAQRAVAEEEKEGGIDLDLDLKL